jgi:O-antigen/teichoic acid export membrane protein
MSFNVIKNALANVVRGGATAAVALALPHFLVHSLDADRFGGWSLMLQLAGYMSFLDFGLQTAVARFIAHALELEQHDRAQKLIETALAMLSLAALLALSVIGIVVMHVGSLFHGIPYYLLHEFQVAALVLALGATLQLPLSTFTGVLVGLRQNELTALAIAGSRLIGAAAAILAARQTHSLAITALCVAIPNLMGGILQVIFVVHRLPNVRIFRISIDRTSATDFFHYCAGLTVWTIGMLFISGLDVTIVGHYQFAAVGVYAIAATFTNLLAGTNSTVMSAFLAPFAAMQARGDFETMRGIVIRSTRLNTSLNLLLLAIVIAYGQPLLRAWVGSSYAGQVYPILLVLMVTQTIRLTASSLSIALMSTGHQNSGIPPALIEALTNLFVSLWAVTRFGAIGVAYGSLVGSLIAFPALLFFTMRTKVDLTVTRSDFALKGICMGAAPSLPIVACASYVLLRHPGPISSLALWTASTACGALLLMKSTRSSLPGVPSAPQRSQKDSKSKTSG